MNKLSEARPWPRLMLLVIAALLSACAPVRLVEPYDEVLVSRTEALYAEASEMIDDGINLSPLNSAERAAIRPSARSPAHYSVFAPRYDRLIRASDALILRSMANSDALDPFGRKVQDGVRKLIDNAAPSTCDELKAEFANAGSLTVDNYVDLKCLLIRWKAQHGDRRGTDNTLILKRANWEGRRRTLFDYVLEVQRAERAKRRP